jgi:hypothetical protein
MNYISPEEVLTFLPNETRNKESREDLITHIIRGYQQLEINQDKDYQRDIIQITDNSNYVIPDHYKHIHSIHLLDKFCVECSYEYAIVYPTNIRSNYCKDKNVCTNNCKLKYSIENEILRLPRINSSYVILHSTLYSDNLKIFNDPVVIEYLKYYVIHEVLLNRSLSNDVSINLLDRVSQQMNALYAKARGQAIMKSIKFSNQKLNTNPHELSIDEFNYRHTTAITTRRDI